MTAMMIHVLIFGRYGNEDYMVTGFAMTGAGEEGGEWGAGDGYLDVAPEPTYGNDE